MKRVIITGASGGIGSACARRFAAEGWQVLAGYRSHGERAETLAEEEKSGRIVPFYCDVTDPDSVRRFVSKAVYSFGGVDAAVLNAGVARDMPLFSETPDGFDKVFDTNIKGVYFGAQAAAKEIAAAGGGSIVAVSSMWGVAGAAGESAYSASKAAVIGLVRSLAKELSTSRIRVNAVAPGVIDTEMNAAYGEEALSDLCDRTPLGRLGTPEEIASVVYFLASDESSFVTGQTVVADGGFLL